MVIPEVLGLKLDDTILVTIGARKGDIVHVGRRGPHEIPLYKRLSRCAAYIRVLFLCELFLMRVFLC